MHTSAGEKAQLNFIVHSNVVSNQHTAAILHLSGHVWWCPISCWSKCATKEENSSQLPAHGVSSRFLSNNPLRLIAGIILLGAPLSCAANHAILPIIVRLRSAPLCGPRTSLGIIQVSTKMKELTLIPQPTLPQALVSLEQFCLILVSPLKSDRYERVPCGKSLRFAPPQSPRRPQNGKRWTQPDPETFSARPPAPPDRRLSFEGRSVFFGEPR